MGKRNSLYIENLTRSHGPVKPYQPPTKTREDYQTEIEGLKKEITLAEAKIIKLSPNK